MKPSTFAAVLLFGVSALGFASPASADPCDGDKLESRTVSVGPDEVGRLELYYDRVSGLHCAAMKHVGLTEKKAGFTFVSLAACQDRLCRTVLGPPRLDSDTQYVEEAGPLRLDARGKCVVANGLIAYKGETYAVKGVPHCG